MKTDDSLGLVIIDAIAAWAYLFTNLTNEDDDIGTFMTFLSGQELFFPSSELVVTKTDIAGRITYANDIFITLSGFKETELLGKPHNIVRHPHMPKCIFQLLWQVIQSGQELFAYVLNRSKKGDHYWVYAHVTPWLDDRGDINGYHSNRRVPNRQVLEEVIIPFYQDLLEIQNQADTHAHGLEQSQTYLRQKIQQLGFSSYEEFIHYQSHPNR